MITLQPTRPDGTASKTLAAPHPAFGRFPKPISSRAHAYADMCAFPAIMSLAAWMWPRNRNAALLIAGTGLLEGTTAAITNFPPPGPFPLIAFRTHVRIGLVGAPLLLAVASLTPGIPWVHRRVVVLLSLAPAILNGLSNTDEKP